MRLRFDLRPYLSGDMPVLSVGEVIAFHPERDGHVVYSVKDALLMADTAMRLVAQGPVRKATVHGRADERAALCVLIVDLIEHAHAAHQHLLDSDALAQGAPSGAGGDSAPGISSDPSTQGPGDVSGSGAPGPLHKPGASLLREEVAP